MSKGKKKFDIKTIVKYISDHPNAVMITLLVICPPVGLYLMWKKGCYWAKWIKSLVSAGMAAVFLAVMILLPNPPNPVPEGGVEIHARTENKKAFAPFKPDGVPDTAQILKSAHETSSLISEPTPTPDPMRVYCNDNGLYYHYKECRYVYDTTPRVTLAQAIAAGKSACPDCKPPTEVSY
ncbi:MAG: hypothetical protein IJC48_07470 [Clostridia bacterium]|nr:hypothetical protein [Clostridia bacterium]MBQ4159015.1 hypothetical protein [Clostridia bacterium]